MKKIGLWKKLASWLLVFLLVLQIPVNVFAEGWISETDISADNDFLETENAANVEEEENTDFVDDEKIEETENDGFTDSENPSEEENALFNDGTDPDHSGRGPEHQPGADENVPDPAGLRLQDRHYRRRDSNRPARRQALRSAGGHAGAEKGGGHRYLRADQRRRGASCDGPADREGL